MRRIESSGGKWVLMLAQGGNPCGGCISEDDEALQGEHAGIMCAELPSCMEADPRYDERQDVVWRPATETHYV